ncbi:MAG: helix-turn-helix domain-containing protein [Actinomycetota bacterium]|nr:helix-turn-helix domain-containing protein [Actinomycetota bacterium]
MDAKQRLWTTNDLAQHLRVPVATIHRWRYQGTAPRALRIGKHLRYRPEDIAAWLQERCTDSKGDGP